jgi:hypothetical protein
MAISIKGILVGLVFGVIMSLVGGLVMGFVMGLMFGQAGVEQVMGTTLTAPVFFMDAVISVAVGYVAARVAGRGELINAVLCNLIGAGIGLFITTAMVPEALVMGLVLLATEPLFGLLGGYMRLRQVTEYA